MSARKSDRAERRRAQHIRNAQQLERAGFVDHAVKQYVAAQAPDRAAELLVGAGRLPEAVQLLGRYPEREHAVMAAALRQRAGDEVGSAKALAALGSRSAPARVRYTAGSFSIPGERGS